MFEYPINIVASVYKIMAKKLANRLRVVAHKVIEDNQFAFIKAKQLLNYVLIARKIINRLKKDHKGELLFNIDFKKVNDNVREISRDDHK